MNKKVVKEILTGIKKGLIVGLVGVLFPINPIILLILLLLWIYVPICDRYTKDDKR
jgi:hypothetical protein